MKDIKSNWTEIKRELVVLGEAWGGFRAKHTYPLGPDQTPANLREAKLIAGDFASLECATVLVTTTIVNQTLSQTCLK